MRIKWVTYLAEFDANFIYRLGKTNVADSLSRSTSLLCVMETHRMTRIYVGYNSIETGLHLAGQEASAEPLE